jgi:ABC-2 type transport system permease protein
MSDATRVAGTIYDLGYQHYDGPRLGRGHAFRTLVAYSMASAFGLGRGEKAKALPAIGLALVYLPVFVRISAAASSGRAEFINYAQQLEFSAFFLALFAAAQAPELIVVDRQFGVLPLYLSRSLRATDYAIAKLVAFIGAFLVFTLGPALAMYAGKVFISPTPWQAFTSDWKTLMPLVGGTTLAAVYMAAIGVALASFASRRAYGTAAVIAFFLLMPAFQGMLAAMVPKGGRRYTVLVNPFFVMTGFANWLFDVQQRRGRGSLGAVVRADLPGQWYLYVMLGVTAIAVAVVLFRYWRSAE